MPKGRKAIIIHSKEEYDEGKDTSWGSFTQWGCFTNPYIHLICWPLFVGIYFGGFARSGMKGGTKSVSISYKQLFR